MPPLLRLLLDLAKPEHADLLKDFLKDPEAVMTRYGLTPGEQQLVLSGDLAAIREAIDAAYTASGEMPPSSDETYAIVVTWAPRKKRAARMIGVWG